jgi:hypothetical protein
MRAAMPSFLRGHIEAFRYFGAVPRVILYDNLKSAVIERQGDAIRFHSTMLALAGHYRFEPRICAPYRPNEKGRVERAIRDLRDNFFAARTFSSVDDLNAQALVWCREIAQKRRVPEAKDKTLGQAFEQEQSLLIELPADDFPVEEHVEVRVGKTPYVRFDKNDYSVPHTSVQRTLRVIPTDDRVRVMDPHKPTVVLADHPRSFFGTCTPTVARREIRANSRGGRCAKGTGDLRVRNVRRIGLSCLASEFFDQEEVYSHRNRIIRTRGGGAIRLGFFEV